VTPAPALQAGEIHRVLARAPLPALTAGQLVECARALAGAVPAVHASLATGLYRGDLLIPRRPPHRQDAGHGVHAGSPVMLWTRAGQLATVPALQATERALQARRALSRLVDHEAQQPAGTGHRPPAPGRVPPRQRLEHLFSM
jgi:hypothetical protein